MHPKDVNINMYMYNVRTLYPKNPPNILVKNVMMSLLAGEGEGSADSLCSIIW
jgi:hypothetical protein